MAAWGQKSLIADQGRFGWEAGLRLDAPGAEDRLGRGQSNGQSEGSANSDLDG